MEYRYNAERDRLDRFSYNPAFLKATYISKDTERNAYLWTCTSNQKNVTCTAESFANEEEEMTDVNLISKEEYMNWLFQGKDTLEIDGEKIPTAYILRVLIAMDQPGARPEQRKGRYGDLCEYKEQLEKGDPQILHQIVARYRASRPEADIVREVPDVDIDALRPVTKFLAEKGDLIDLYPPEEEKDER